MNRPQRWSLAAMVCSVALAACVQQNGTCEEVGTCVDCNDPNFAREHPGECLLPDAGLHDDAAVEAAVAADATDASAPSGQEAAPDASDARGTADVAEGGTIVGPEASVADAGAAPEAGPPIDAGPDVPACDGTRSPSVDPCVIDDRFGVFVTPTGNDTAAGTQAAPLRTLAAALALAHQRNVRVYACDGGTSFAETMTINANLGGAALFGGFTCTSAQWAYSTSRRAVVRPATGPALSIQVGSTGALLEDFELEGADATAAGASSFGAMVNQASAVVLRRVRIVAGQAATGAPGVNGAAGNDGTPAGPGQNGQDAICGAGRPNTQLGGFWPVVSLCGSLGGAGGGSTLDVGNDGLFGRPITNVTPANFSNEGGSGVNPTDGMPGSPGDPGLPGTAMTVTDPGTFSSLGFTPAARAPSGQLGHPGQGGGGGGASNAVGNCVGASAGAGGMGGCGGQLGTGGAGGGASVALFVWMSDDVALDACDIVAGRGGAGGVGGNGGPGGMGAAGGMGGAAAVNTRAGASGGIGGDGGQGGPGSGGNGGPSYALVFSGPTPTRANTTFTAGTPGPRGAGGTGAGPARGANGVAGAAAMEFVVTP